MKKKLLILLSALLVLLLLVGCGNQEGSEKPQEPEEPQYADETFMEDLAQGLMDRWDAANSENAPVDGYSEEYKEHLISLIDLELAKVADYRSAQFEDRNLQEAAISYINILEDTKEAAMLLTADYEEYLKQWEPLYDERAKAIAAFANDFGLTVDEAHQTDLSEFVIKAKQVEEDEAVKESFDNMIAALDFQLSEDSYGLKTYTATLVNNIGVDFDYISLEINLMDEAGTIIEQTYAGTNTLADGQSIILDFMTDKNFASYEINADYILAE